MLDYLRQESDFSTQARRFCWRLTSRRFVVLLQAHPIHLWDACTGALRCVYRAYDAADEVTAAYAVAFDQQGAHIWAGYNKAIRVFDLSRPGRDCQTISTFRKGQDGQPGILQVSTLRHFGLV